MLYLDKEYSKEVEFVSSIIQRHAPGARTVLDLGCGTGIHACALAQKGYRVTGLDRSVEMLAIAHKRGAKTELSGSGAVEFQQSDIRDFKLPNRFDVVVALFDVISYLTTNPDQHAAFARIQEHLSPGGLLIFDHWYGPAVLTDRPTPRTKTFEDDEVKIHRFATPTLSVNDNVVNVRYDLVVVDKLLGRCREIVEIHRMRYLFWPEIVSLLLRHGLKPLEFCEWLSGREPDQSTWNTFVAAVRPKTK
jgi:SAM-dependent methyltransferase